MPYTNRTYTKQGIFNLYPEQINGRWKEMWRQDEQSSWQNTDRKPIPLDQLPSDFKTYMPISRRVQLPLCLTPLSDEAKQEIRDNAESREDFHDYDEILHWRSRLPECLCELRIITGEDCIQHFAKGADGRTAQMPGNKHWAWFIDICPRGDVCPRAVLRKNAGRDFPIGFQGCDILINNEGPPEAWVLAQESKDPVGTLAGRAVTDIKLEGLCINCAREGRVDLKTNRFLIDQYNLFKFHKFDLLPRLPMIYRPKVRRPFLDGTAHFMLQYNYEYHIEDLLKYPNVTKKDIWFYWYKWGIGRNKGVTLYQYEALQEAEEAEGEDEW